MVLSAFFSALKQFLCSVEAESMGLPWFSLSFFFLFFLMWLANWLDISAKQSMPKYKVKPWQILVQGVHKIIVAAQSHFTRAVVGNRIRLVKVFKFHVVTWLRVYFLSLGCGAEVCVGFLGFFNEPEPENLRQKFECWSWRERNGYTAGSRAQQSFACSSVASLSKLLLPMSLTCPLLCVSTQWLM